MIKILYGYGVSGSARASNVAESVLQWFSGFFIQVSFPHCTSGSKTPMPAHWILYSGISGVVMQ